MRRPLIPVLSQYFSVETEVARVHVTTIEGAVSASAAPSP